MKYETFESLGQGGNGVVYKARGEDGKTYAVKELKRLNDTGPIRFAREFEEIRKISHPNIIRIIDGNVESQYGKQYYIMEYMEGGTLRSRINWNNEKKLAYSQKRAIEIILQVAKALSHAHKKGIYHRDLKPENILFDRDGTVKVADWGIGRFLDRNSMMLTVGGMGTPSYCSPEQAREAHDVDGRTDIYSLGRIFYELLMGRLPSNDMMFSQPTQPSMINHSACKSIDTIITQMMSSDPNFRHQTIDDVIKDLEALNSETLRIYY